MVLWFNQLDDRYLLGGIIAGAMVINMVVAGIAGVLLAFGLDRMGIDPAVASGVFVTTVTDVIGFLCLPRPGFRYFIMSVEKRRILITGSTGMYWDTCGGSFDCLRERGNFWFQSIDSDWERRENGYHCIAGDLSDAESIER